MIKTATNIPAEQLTRLKAVIRSATPSQLREAVVGLESKPVAGSRGQSAPPRLELRELATPNSYAWAELRHLAFPVQRGRGQNSVILTIHAELAAVIAQRLEATIGSRAEN